MRGIRDDDVTGVRDWNSHIVRTEDGDRLAITLASGKQPVSLHLTPQDAIDLARWLFTNALRLSSHTANGRLSAAISAKLMVQQVQDVEREVQRAERTRK